MAGEDFLKSKMHFTIGLMAALFALHPFFPMLDKIGFTYMGVMIPVSYAFMVIGLLLAAAVYFYATDLMNEEPSSLSQRFGNYFYATAILVVPFYAGMYLTTVVEDILIDQMMIAKYPESSKFAERLHLPAMTIGILVVWIIIWQVFSIMIRRYLTKRDWTTRIDRLVDKEMDALKRADEMMAAKHYDLAVIQWHKAVMLRITMACMKQGFTTGNMIHNAYLAKIINDGNKDYFQTVQSSLEIASGTMPIAANRAAGTQLAVKELLSRISV